MSPASIDRREFLFLQGPPGPFFRELAAALAEEGCGVHRINLSGGDHYDWRRGATNFHGSKQGWPMFFDRFLRARQITDLVLFGDCREMHQIALRLAQLRGVHIHVFEEGYIRPDWMTLERDGVNGHSPMERDPVAILAAARHLPAVPKLPPITASFGRRARDSYWHYAHVSMRSWLFPFYGSHREGSIFVEWAGWGWRLLMAPLRRRQADETLAAIAGRDFFLFPLQLTSDFQIRHHSPFGSTKVALDYVLESFARFAPPESVLLVKEHPLDSSFTHWRGYLHRRAQQLGIHGRAFHIDGGNLDELAADARGMVCVNSTSGTLALEAGTPVAVLGDAVYDVPGVVYDGGLDSFWSNPQAPDFQLWNAFKTVLHARCLVRGGLASASGTAILVRNSVERLLAIDQAPVRQSNPAQVIRAVS
jgi:capsular polysaccharide export protein